MDPTQAPWSSIDISTPKGLARAISLVENSAPGYREWLAGLHYPDKTPIIGITGPPGAGKSTLVNGLISYYTSLDKKIAVIAVDPTSPFNLGSLLGDRIRMAEHYLNPNVFIRSLATRGSLGGLSAKTIEVTDILRAAGFDYILVETVGVGQSEVEIAGLADTTIVVLVPEAGDEIQGLKSGIMEIADIFVVNKADRPGANEFMQHLRKLLHQKPHSGWNIPVIAASATQKTGIEDITAAIERHLEANIHNGRRSALLADKAWHLIQTERMKDLSKKEIALEISRLLKEGEFNLYGYVSGKG